VALARSRGKYVGGASVVRQFVHIPTIGQSPYLPRLLQDLEYAPIERIWVLQNGRPERRPAIEVICRGIRPMYRCQYRYDAATSLYAGWNEAIRKAQAEAQRHQQEVRLHVFNDDIVLGPNVVYKLTLALDAESDITLAGYGIHLGDGNKPISTRHRDVTGTYREGGINGCAWVLRIRSTDTWVPQIDERFEWWGGDDDLVYQLVAANRRCVLFPGMWVKHPNPSLSINTVPDLADAIERDRLRLLARWGRAW
jgi:hypothetical protein